MYVCIDKQSGMNQWFTYSIPTHAQPFPVMADLFCVAEPRPTPTSRPVQPLKGLRNPRAASVSYRALAPNGAGIWCRVCAGISGPQPTANYSLLTRPHLLRQRTAANHIAKDR